MGVKPRRSVIIAVTSRQQDFKFRILKHFSEIGDTRPVPVDKGVASLEILFCLSQLALKIDHVEQIELILRHATDLEADHVGCRKFPRLRLTMSSVRRRFAVASRHKNES